MKRQPVKKGALVGAAYPNVNDPQFRALLKRLAKGTAMAGLAGVMGLAVPACDLFPSDKAPEQDVGPADTTGGDGTALDTPYNTDTMGGIIPLPEDVFTDDTTNQDFELLGMMADVGNTDVVEEDWMLGGAPAEDVCTTEIRTPADTADVENDFALTGDMPMPDSKSK
jgi:hypothetical protein